MVTVKVCLFCKSSSNSASILSYFFITSESLIDLQYTVQSYHDCTHMRLCIHYRVCNKPAAISPLLTWQTVVPLSWSFYSSYHPALVNERLESEVSLGVLPNQISTHVTAGEHTQSPQTLHLQQFAEPDLLYAVRLCTVNRREISHQYHITRYGRLTRERLWRQKGSRDVSHTHRPTSSNAEPTLEVTNITRIWPSIELEYSYRNYSNGESTGWRRVREPDGYTILL